MASVTSLSNSYSSASSIYGNKNILSGLASGMDTESMIENAVSGIKKKISTLGQKRTKVEWQQESLRSIIDKMANFSNKYASYASSTNLLSASFFNNAVKISTAGKFADKVAASGRSSSTIELLGVKQLATNATYNVDAGTLMGGVGADPFIQGNRTGMDWDFTESNVSGTMTIAYGGARSIDITLGDDVYKDADAFAKAINEQLAQTSVTKKNGDVVKASTMVKATVDGDSIKFTDVQNAGNSVSVTGATGKLGETLNLSSGEKRSTLNLTPEQLSTTSKTGDYLSGKEFKVTLDGITKTIKLGKLTKDSTNKELVADLQSKLDDAFGKGKINVENVHSKNGYNTHRFQLKLTTQKGSTMTFQGDAAKALGLDSTRETTYLDTGKTLGSLMRGEMKNQMQSFDKVEAVGDVRQLTNESGNPIDSWVDSKGNAVKSEDGGKTYHQVDAKGAYYHDFTINGVSVGKFSENSAVENVMTAINNNTEAGVTVSFSKATGQFQFTARESGSAGKIEFGEGLAKAMFGAGGDDKDVGSYTAGKDAIFSMKVNGQNIENVSRSSNSFDVDGMTLNLKGTFNYDDAGNLDEKGEAVTFSTSSDADKIVDAVKSMINDYNEMASEVKNAYSTMRATRSGSGNSAKYYEPLTAEDKDGMSESEIKNWEEKAKQGILFGDRDLSSLYSAISDAISPSGLDGSQLRAFGIETSYSGGLTTLSFDEEKFRAALDANPEGVRDAFTKSKENGASSDGLMQGLKTALDRYGKTTGTKGILVERAGSIRAPVTLNNNTIQESLNDIDDQIERWETKLANQIDRYTSQFSKLEQLIAQMNSQSSALMGLMGNSY